MAAQERGHASGNGLRALLEFRAARSGFERVGALRQAERATCECGDGAGEAGHNRSTEPPGRSHPTAQPPAPEAAVDSDANVFSREGEIWCVTFGGHTARLRDAKGLRYLVRLLADPGREFHVFDLVAAERGWTSEVGDANDAELTFSDLGDAGQMLDARAKAAYRRRLAEIDEDISEARAAGDAARDAQANAERDFLLRELSRAVGLRGRDRHAGSASERARVSVTRAIRFAMGRIREHSPQLGEHLDRTARTGTSCAYLPDPRVPVAWRL